MPRKKEFDVDAVLDKAMHAFWKYGYQATSLNDLLDCMQIQRASLYNAFGDKRTLFLDTLHRYDLIYHRSPLAKRMKTASPRQAMMALFQDKVTLEQEKDVRYGCFLINTALELSPHDPEVAEIVGTSPHLPGETILPSTDRKEPSHRRDSQIGQAGPDRARPHESVHRDGCALPRPS